MSPRGSAASVTLRGDIDESTSKRSRIVFTHVLGSAAS